MRLSLRTYLSFVRFGHSIFALPFALTGALLAAREHPATWRQLAWIVAAMVMARSAAMGFNRLVDAKFDAENPRTANRELPRGRLSQAEAIGFVVICSALFVWSAYQLSPVCLALSPVALACISGNPRERYVGDTVVPRPRRGGAPVGVACGQRAGRLGAMALRIGCRVVVGRFDVLYGVRISTSIAGSGFDPFPCWGIERSLLSRASCSGASS